MRRKKSGKIRTLLVDDEKSLTSTLSKRFSRRGMEVATASDATEAFGFLETCHFNVVVLDLNMPGIDGLQTLKAIKQCFHGVEVIIQTGDGGMAEARMAFHAGAFDFLFKPVLFNKLIAKIEEAAAHAPPSPSKQDNAYVTMSAR